MAHINPLASIINPPASIVLRARLWLRNRRIVDEWLADYCSRTGKTRDEVLDERRANRIHDETAEVVGTFDGYVLSTIYLHHNTWRYTVETPWDEVEGLCDSAPRDDNAAIYLLRQIAAIIRNESHSEPISDEIPADTGNHTDTTDDTPDFGSQKPTEAPRDDSEADETASEAPVVTEDDSDAPEDDLDALIAQRDAAAAELAEMPTRGRPSRRKRHLVDILGKLDERIAALDPSYVPDGAKGAPKASDTPAKAKRRAPRLTRGTEETGWLNSRGEFDRKAYMEHLDEICKPMDEALASMLRRVS